MLVYTCTSTWIKYVVAAVLAANRSAGVTPEINLRGSIACGQ